MDRKDKNDEEVILKALRDVLVIADSAATLRTIRELAAILGVSQIQGMPIEQFFAQRKVQLAEELIANYSDQNPRLATALKAAWEKAKTERL
jgi:hypothetical protein